MSDTLADMARLFSFPAPLALAVLALPSLVALPAPALAWGAMGHRLVAALATDELGPHAQKEIVRLLQSEAYATLPGIATWADELREHDPDLGRRSSAWHYVNLGEEQCTYEATRDCKGGNCVVEAIVAQAAILGDRKRSDVERVQALKFVVHFVGDVHQPLHAGHAHDKGGNTVQVSIDGKGTNLHSLWDSRLLASAGLDEAVYLQYLRALPVAVPMPLQPLPPDSASWARHACAIATQPGVYPASAKLPEGYADRWRPVAEEQLRRAGAQLALLLNAALAP